MKRLCALVLLALIACSGGAHAEGDVALDFLSFTPPEGIISQQISDEDAARGIAYAAQSSDGQLRLVVLCEKVRRSTDASTAAFIERLMGKGGAEETETITVDGVEFALATETVEEGDRSVFFRSATAVRNDRLVTFFIIDYDGEHADLPAQLVRSVRWSE